MAVLVKKTLNKLDFATDFAILIVEEEFFI